MQVKSNPKLTLNKQSVSRLTAADLQQVKGGKAAEEGAGTTSLRLCTNVGPSCCVEPTTTVTTTIIIVSGTLL